MRRIPAACPKRARDVPNTYPAKPRAGQEHTLMGKVFVVSLKKNTQRKGPVNFARKRGLAKFRENLLEAPQQNSGSYVINMLFNVALTILEFCCCGRAKTPSKVKTIIEDMEHLAQHEIDMILQHHGSSKCC